MEGKGEGIPVLIEGVDGENGADGEMPEISMNSQYAEMIRIHSSLIYGIVHGFIVVYPSSQIYDKDKKVSGNQWSVLV